MISSAPTDYCFLWMQSACMPRADWAAWVQAVGSLLAIAAAWWIARLAEKSRAMQETSARQVRSLRFIAGHQKLIDAACDDAVAANEAFSRGRFKNGVFHFRLFEDVPSPHVLSESALKLLPLDEVDIELSGAITAFIFAAQDLERKFVASGVEHDWSDHDMKDVDYTLPARTYEYVAKAFEFVEAEAKLLKEAVSGYTTRQLRHAKATRLQRWSKSLGIDFPVGAQTGDLFTVTIKDHDGSDKQSSMRF